MSQAGWNTIGVRKSRRPVAVYGNKNCDGLKAPNRKYECVVIAGDKSEVSKWISDYGVNVMDVSRLSKDDADARLFKVCVDYKAKDTALSSDIWPEYGGCRPFLELGSSPTGSQMDNNNIMADRHSIATLNCEGIRKSIYYIRNTTYPSIIVIFCVFRKRGIWMIIFSILTRFILIIYLPLYRVSILRIVSYQVVLKEG